MGVCDLCNVPLGANASQFSPNEMRAAVRAGLRPTGGMIDVMVSISGFSNDEHWVQRVMTDNTDWAMCDSCAVKTRGYVSQTKTWWQFWKS